MPCTVKLLDTTDLAMVSYAAKVCIGAEANHPLDRPDHGVILRCIDKGHHSVLEHCVMVFEIEDITRAVLFELTRHRIASYSVQSTRLALKRMLKDVDEDTDWMWPVPFLESTGDPILNTMNVDQLRQVKRSLDNGLKPDYVKTALPEAFLTKLVMTINLRSFRNLMTLRSDNAAFYQIRDLAQKMFMALPYEIALMCEDCLPRKGGE